MRKNKSTDLLKEVRLASPRKLMRHEAGAMQGPGRKSDEEQGPCGLRGDGWQREEGERGGAASRPVYTHFPQVALTRHLPCLQSLTAFPGAPHTRKSQLLLQQKLSIKALLKKKRVHKSFLDSS